MHGFDVWHVSTIFPHVWCVSIITSSPEHPDGQIYPDGHIIDVLPPHHFLTH